MGLMGDPVAAPCSCSKNQSWNWKCAFLRQNSCRLMICFTLIDVLCWSFSSTDINMKSEETLIRGMHSSCWSCILWIWPTKSFVFLIWWRDLFTSGLKTQASSFSISYVVVQCWILVAREGKSFCTRHIHRFHPLESCNVISCWTCLYHKAETTISLYIFKASPKQQMHRGNSQIPELQAWTGQLLVHPLMNTPDMLSTYREMQI